MLRIEPTLPMLKMEPALPILAMLTKLRRLLWLKALRALRALLKLSDPETSALGEALGGVPDRPKRGAAYLPKAFAPIIFMAIFLTRLLSFRRRDVCSHHTPSQTGVYPSEAVFPPAYVPILLCGQLYMSRSSYRGTRPGRTRPSFCISIHPPNI
jgi:hypothetical protein